MASVAANSKRKMGFGDDASSIVPRRCGWGWPSAPNRAEMNESFRSGAMGREAEILWSVNQSTTGGVTGDG